MLKAFTANVPNFESLLTHGASYGRRQHLFCMKVSVAIGSLESLSHVLTEPRKSSDIGTACPAHGRKRDRSFLAL